MNKYSHLVSFQMWTTLHKMTFLYIILDTLYCILIEHQKWSNFLSVLILWLPALCWAHSYISVTQNWHYINLCYSKPWHRREWQLKQEHLIQCYGGTSWCQSGKIINDTSILVLVAVLSSQFCYMLCMLPLLAVYF